ncbi:MAG: hypothetical protein ABJG15_11040 [Hyphomonadaceae bacterium]
MDKSRDLFSGLQGQSVPALYLERVERCFDRRGTMMFGLGGITHNGVGAQFQYRLE